MSGVKCLTHHLTRRPRSLNIHAASQLYLHPAVVAADWPGIWSSIWESMLGRMVALVGSSIYAEINDSGYRQDQLDANADQITQSVVAGFMSKTQKW